ncbi:PHP domain-containing protein [Myceligenerans pegani]|uniref:PHP domain-containing protein n=1 Tax=Myceligenerans pegani TaxID=2776917 RepID=A0ABR9MU79_9MICO|nr:PHP domain-containing protein [Myceligenerans sp. TRM 65318]MBE1874705.1 PHP domain-containing protein [Myceligenerans sp. TRM 65318]MBE3016976.1 PHP domain-containing protein [Myceligenerans sp. TRM 65318]
MIDLHTHSTASDGTDTPAQVVKVAAAAGLAVVALTDHDTTAGWAEAATAAATEGVALVRGIEISAHALVGGRPVGVHVLAYLHDPEHAGLLAELTRTRESRATRAERMAGLLAADYPITWEDVLAQTEPGTTIGRPHLADALVAAGAVADRDEAFATMLRTGSRYYVPHYAPDAADVVRLVRDAGGVPVFAHPGADGRGRIVPDRTIAELAGVGLAGLEVDHRDHDAVARRRLAALADELGLLVTGSSDYHGRGKLNVIGENTTRPEVLAEIERQGALAVLRPGAAGAAGTPDGTAGERA